MRGALSSYSEEEASGSVGSSPKKYFECANTQKEPCCKESNNLTDEYVASEIHESKGSEIGCSALHLPTADQSGATLKDNIVPLERKPYFTIIMGKNNVCRQFVVKIPRNFNQFLPSSSTRIVLCCREKEWIAKCTVYQSGKVIREGWTQFVMDNKLKIGDGCVFELMNNKEMKFRVQILNGEIPASLNGKIPASANAFGNNIDTPILID